MVGGKGWENNSFLDSLGGGDEDREKAQDEYKEFHESREAFMERQKQRMATPEGQRFMKQQQQRDQNRGMSWQDEGDAKDIIMGRDENFVGRNDFDDLDTVGGSSGGSRFRNMMQQSKMKKQGMAPQRMTYEDPLLGQQKFVVPLEDEDSPETYDPNAAAAKKRD